MAGHYGFLEISAVSWGALWVKEMLEGDAVNSRRVDGPVGGQMN